MNENLRNELKGLLKNKSKQEVYKTLAMAIRDQIMENWQATRKTYDEQDVKQVYYLSMEFLMGRALSNNMINLGVDKDIKELLQELDIDINAIEDEESDAGLGNGGLGRLAACFLDSLATLELPGHGASIKYKYGLFKQDIRDGYQIESPDEWLSTGELWLDRQEQYSVIVKIGNDLIKAVPYDMPIVGYGNKTVNNLRLWDAVSICDDCIDNPYVDITNNLYPADDNYEGRKLRLKQEYFFTSATIQSVLDRFYSRHDDFNLLPEKAQFQLNDTHPTVAIAEMMRVLMDDYRLGWDQAWEITNKTCSYTNHTIMSEALEKWETELFKGLLPRVYEIIEEINRRFCRELIDKGYPQYKINNMAIISDGRVKMAHLAIVGGHSVNGVAALHTEILKNQELKDFYELYPWKFNNKTNGITQRRWLLKSNPELSDLITSKIGNGWITNLSELKQLERFVNDEEFKAYFKQIKFNNKIKLANYIKEHTGIEINPYSIFDVQVKRLHEYKRQLLNALHILHLYNKIKENPNVDIVPHTFIFGAKSAPAYYRAKLIIKLINSIADLVNGDSSINEKIKVVFLENYRVSLAEKIFPASDVSEQISTASMEASGTGNMKFMLNGAMTLGTMDGANVEIVKEAGIENEFIFGLSSEEVINHQRYYDYNPRQIYESDYNLRRVIDQLVDGTLNSNRDLFRELYDVLVNDDRYFILKDFGSYVDAQERIDKAYIDEDRWVRMSITNVANSGFFSSDRTIQQYADEIWGLHKVRIDK